MKNLFIFCFALCCSGWVNGQPVGIDGTPTRAMLEVQGVAGIGNTSGVFAPASTGISLQRNWPTIGFNQYRDNTVGNGRYISNGFAALQTFDIGTGAFTINLFPSGQAGSFTPGGVRVVTVLANGNTAFGGVTPTATLSAAKWTNFNGAAVFQHNNSSHFYYSGTEDTYLRAGVNGSNVYINNIPSGNVLIGYNSTEMGINTGIDPVFTLEVVQPNGMKALSMRDSYGYKWSMAANFINTLNNGQGVALDLYYNGTGRGRFQYWNGAYIQLSDARVKTNVEPLPPVLDRIARLNTVRYEINNNNPKHEKSIGFIAQEVKPLFPMLVRQVEDISLKGGRLKDLHVMDYSGFGVLAIKALQEQQVEINTLKKEHDELMERLAALEVKIAATH
ncbi:MAG TPA: tail fiber domain-containing protein [Phnomibacter sp.]|nr:tail fiber domain-containing protein [Phnomibacter sp.]